MNGALNGCDPIPLLDVVYSRIMQRNADVAVETRRQASYLRVQAPSPPPPMHLPVLAGFRYLREAAELQKSRIATVFEQIVRNQGLDPSILETKNRKVCRKRYKLAKSSRGLSVERRSDLETGFYLWPFSSGLGGCGSSRGRRGCFSSTPVL